MAEVPPHLLDRSRARRAALGLGTEGGEGSAEGATATAPTPVVAAGPAAVAPVRSAAAAPSAPAEPVYIAPPVPKGSSLAKLGSVFFLIATPIWALFMFNSFNVPKSLIQTPAEIGQTLYSTNNCVTCHLANGAGKEGGGVGRPLYNGNAELTFPDPLEQVAFVKHGSCATGTPYGNPTRAGGQHQAIGNMPSFDGVLTDEQILYVVAYERSVLSGKDFPTDLYAKVGEQPNPARVLAPGAPATTIAPVSIDKVCG